MAVLKWPYNDQSVLSPLDLVSVMDSLIVISATMMQVVSGESRQTKQQLKFRRHHWMQLYNGNTYINVAHFFDKFIYRKNSLIQGIQRFSDYSYEKTMNSYEKTTDGPKQVMTRYSGSILVL